MISAPRPASPEDVARHYDELDRFYRDLWGEHLHHGLFEDPGEDPQVAAARLVERIAALAALEPGHHVCDVGCGYGATARQLARERGVQVTAITLSGAQLAHARRVTPPDAPVHFVQGDWLDNAFPDEAFDAVVAVESLSHMADKDRFFHEVRRTLRPGGRLVICAWIAGEEAGPTARRWLLEPICREGALPGMPTERECRDFLARAGLILDEVQDLTRPVRPTWAVSGRRLLGAFLRNPALRRAALDPGLRNRSFALSVFRIRLAYRVGAMRYLVFAARRPRDGEASGPPETGGDGPTIADIA